MIRLIDVLVIVSSFFSTLVAYRALSYGFNLLYRRVEWHSVVYSMLINVIALSTIGVPVLLAVIAPFNYTKWLLAIEGLTIFFIICSFVADYKVYRRFVRKKLKRKNYFLAHSNLIDFQEFVKNRQQEDILKSKRG